MNHEMKYVISMFDKKTEEFLGDIDISEVGGSALAELFGVSTERFVESYPVGEREAAAISKLTCIEFDLAHVDYFVDPYRK